MCVRTHLSLRIAACLSAASLAAGCNWSDFRARSALSAYQSATASNDWPAAHRALLELVQAKDDVPDYWVQLGKLDSAMGNFDDAYYAFSRAYELDRSNVDVLRAVTQLALRSGDLTSARTHAQELEVLSPGDPWPKITAGWAAINELHYDQAIQSADEILANNPYDPSAKVLKARALIGMLRNEEAKDLLVKQVQAQPSDVASLQLLARIYSRENDWPKLLQIAKRLSQLAPANTSYSVTAIEAAFRSGDIRAARSMSHQLLRPAASPGLVNSVLDLWANFWPSQQRLADARALAPQANTLPAKLAYASFLSRFGGASDAVRLASSAAATPINASNAEANAVLGAALSHLGNIVAAKSRLDAVLAFDPGNATALRARAELELGTGQTKAAVVDAQKLTTVLPNSSPDRLLLARAYAAEGNMSWVNRTLWSAFQEIPADEKLFAALLSTKKGDPDATRELQEEFEHQRDSSLGRGLM